MADIQPIDRRVEEGLVYELSRRGEAFDVKVEGRTLLATDSPRNAQSLAELAIAPWEGRDDVTVLLGGLGAGHTLRALLARPEVAHIDVVEISRAVIDWEKAYFGDAGRDRRVTMHAAELGAFLRQPRPQEAAGWFVALVDVDEWPITLARPENVELYHDEGLRAIETILRPAGVAVLWSATRRDDELDARMRRRFTNVARVVVPVDAGVDYVYRGRRGTSGQA